VSETGGPIFLKLQSILVEAFPGYRGAFSSSTEPEAVPGWDSTAHVGLIVEIEDAFGVEFAGEEYTSFKTVGELARLIEAKSR
jgi:acyl carrier protein